MNAYRGLQPWLIPYAEYLVSVGRYYRMSPRITSTYRSRATQARLYSAYLSGKSQFPAAPPGRSYHEYGRAFDMVTGNMRDLEYLGSVWLQLGGRWWKSDPIHFEA